MIWKSEIGFLSEIHKKLLVVRLAFGFDQNLNTKEKVPLGLSGSHGQGLCYILERGVDLRFMQELLNMRAIITGIRTHRFTKAKDWIVNPLDDFG